MMIKSASIVNLFLLFLVLLSIIGTQFVNFYENNFLLLLLIPILSFIPILVAFDKIPERYYSIAVIATALALLFHTSLISMYIWGADINKEYYYASLTKSNYFWNSDISHPYNSMLSISILAPICSMVSGIDLTWIFKLIFPLLFSFVPLILYQTFKRQTDSKTAFLSSFFFSSLFTFYTEMNSIARQQIAEVFFALLMLLIVSKNNLNPQKRLLLFIIFCFSLVTAHYALTIIFVLVLLFSTLFTLCLKHTVGNNLINACLLYTSPSPRDLSTSRMPSSA